MMTSSSGTAADSEAFVFIHHRQDRLNFISFHQENASSVGTTVANLSNFIFFQDRQFQDFHYCNGLLAFVFQLRDDGHKDFLVYNPTTSQQRHIPRINLLERKRRFVALNIVFHPVKSYGYKLVCVWSERYMPSNELSRTSLRKYGFSIYSSETGIWRDTKATYGRDFAYIYFMNGMLWNGDLHWVSGRRENLFFDLDKECLALTMPSPCMHHSESDILYFGVSGSSLYLIEVNRPQALLFDIFELKRDYSEWVLKYQIDLTPVTTLNPSVVDEVSGPFGDGRCRFCTTCFRENGEKKPRFVISLMGKVILCDVEDVLVKELVEVGQTDIDRGWKNSFYHWSDTYQFVQTLANV